MSDTAKEDAMTSAARGADVASLHDHVAGPGASGQSNGLEATRTSNAQETLPRPDTGLSQDLDRVSLVQALIDAEAATARVIDLTERLVDARRQMGELRGELEQLRIEYEQYRAGQERLRSSKAFRLAERLWTIRNALGI